MPVTLTLNLTINDADLAKIAAALGTAPALAEGRPAVDVTPAAAPADAAPTKGKKGKQEKAPEQEPEPEQAQDDLTTEKQNEAVKETADNADDDTMREGLTGYYESSGMSKKAIQKHLATLSGDDLRAAYQDYLARLIKDENGEFPESMDDNYAATRIFGGEEVVRWCRGGLTLTEEEVEAAGLGDAAESLKPKEPVKKGPALPTRKK